MIVRVRLTGMGCRIQELLSKHRRNTETTRIEMKKAGEARMYTKAISLQHDLETGKV